MAVKKIKLGDYCDIEKGKTGIKKAVPGEYPMVVTASERITHNEYDFDCKAVIIPLVSSTGHGHASINRLHYQEGKFALGTILAALTVKDESVLDPRFLYIYLSYFKDQLLVPLMKGSANVSLNIGKIAGVEIVLPTIERQRKIIELEKENKNVAELQNEICKQRDLLHKLREIILVEAITGKLTKQWREKNDCDESGADLLQRIKSEKDRLLKTGVIKKDYAFPDLLDKEIVFEIPNNWTACRLGDIGIIKGGKRLPKGHKFSDAVTDYPYLRIVEMKNETIDSSNLVYISEKTREIIKNYSISEDDLYITIAGTIGAAGMVPKGLGGANLTENAAKLSVIEMNREYILKTINSELVQTQYKGKTKGATIPKLALKRIASTIIPVPPLDEQKIIVEKIKELFRYLDAFDNQINENRENVRVLMLAVLRDALVS